MNICVLGFGHVGSRLAYLWSEAGHRLLIGLRPGSERAATAQKAGMEVLEPRLAVESSDAITLALPWKSTEEVLGSLGSLSGRVLIDVTNPLNSDLTVTIPQAGSGAQQIAAWSPGAKVVKAFNTIGAECLGNPAFDMYYCSDDDDAANVVRDLIKDIRMQPVYVGPLKNAGYLEQMAGLWIDLSVRNRIQEAFGFNLVREHGR